MPDANSNTDPQELARFNALASRWWDPRGEFRTLHQINPVRLEYIARAVGGLAGKRVLDLGCGGGVLSEAMAAAGAQVTGLDLAPDLLTVARLHLLESGVQVEYQHSSGEAWARAHPGRYDVVTCLEMIEHVPDPSSVVRACAQLVRPGGDVFFSTLNRNLRSFLLAIVGAEYIAGILPRGTHEYGKFIRPSELDTWARQAGLGLVHATGLEYDPFTESASLKSDIRVNYLAHFRRPEDQDAVDAPTNIERLDD